MKQLFDPSVSGLSHLDMGYMGDVFIDERYADRYPEWITFDALDMIIQIWPNLFLMVANWELWTSEAGTVCPIRPGKEESHWRFAAFLIDLRTCLVVLQESVPNFRTIDDTCLRLWPGQPPLTPMDDLQETAITECHDIARRVLRLTMSCCEEAKTLAPAVRTMNIQDVMEAVKYIPIKVIRDGLPEFIGCELDHDNPDLKDGINDGFMEQLQFAAKVDMILKRLRSLYMIDKYGCSDPLIPEQQQNGKAGSSTSLDDLVVDIEARTVRWRDSPIPGLNGHSHFNLVRILHERQGGIVKNADLHNAIKGNDPLTVKGGNSGNATPELMNTISQVKQLFRGAAVTIEIKNFRAIGYKLS